MSGWSASAVVARCERRRARRGAGPRVGLLALLVLTASGCGASIQAVYESDIRFEHCMALDAQPSIDTADRRQCWSEWLAHYTYGQTRDRVVHAQVRLQQLSESARMPGESPAEDAHRPTSSLMLAPDGHATDDACSSTCERSYEECRSGCTTPACSDGCGASRLRCFHGC